MKNLSYKIRDMDCGEEIAMIKKVLVPVLGDEKLLHFDLLDNKLTVEIPSGTEINNDRIVEIISGTGMKAEPCDSSYSKEREEIEESFWKQNIRSILFAFSASLLLTGFLIHSFSLGLLEAFSGEYYTRGSITETIVKVLYFASAVIGGRYIFPKAWFSLRKLRPDMNLLMSIAVVGAFIIGEWFEAAFVIFLFSLALLLESWSIGRARNAIKTLIELKPQSAKVKDTETGKISELPVEKISVGSHLLISPGEKIPLDGKVISGESYINQSAITGESVPVFKSAGDDVFAGTVNEEGLIEIVTSKSVDDTTLARIIELVEKARSNRAHTEQWVDRFAAYYTPAMIFLAIIIATAPPVILGQSWMEWIYQALVILVIGCPCALVISTPVSIVAALTTASRNGILIKGGIYLETLSRLKTIAFDKTGTLTYGKPVVRKVVSMNDHTEAEILKYASALEVHSTHPVAKAIVEHTRKKEIDFTPAEEFRLKMGMGAEGSIGGRMFCIGSTRLMKENGLDTPEYLERISALEEQGITAVALCEKEHICAIIGISDEVRSNSAETVKELKRSGIERIIMLTGDNQKTALSVSTMTGIEDFRAGLFPEEKAKAIEKLGRETGNTAMVGDGINDAPAMAAASIGIAMGDIGSDSAIETSDITLMSGNIERLPWLIRHSHKTLNIIKQNIIFALGLKLLFVILAIAGLATLWMAIAADMGASLLVIFNALRLLNKKKAD
ncbi:MAG: cadmium-translocating P-type ATPase [bacterium]|nr:cadmium-translocating P-type ATPase [bacterium]